MISLLERLEQKLGKSPRTLGDHQYVCQKALDDPASLDELDRATLEYFGVPMEVERALDAKVPPTPAAGAAAIDDDTIRVALEAIVKLFDFVEDMNERNKERNARLDALEQRIATLEAKPTLHDAGVWEAGKVYEGGAVVTHHGSAWVCGATHLATGSDVDHTHFRLMIKRGRDAR